MSERTKLSKRIVEAVNQMPAKVRRVFVFSHYRGFSLQEIAGCLGMKEEEVESLLWCGNALISRTVLVP
jgi:DNA-directed RNA polymerase specialized sigma24 family protein